MSIRGWLLVACAGFGVAHLVGEVFHSPLLPAAELFAWLSLGAYLVVAGRDAPPRVRLALAAGLLILGFFPIGSLLSTMDSSSSVASFQFLSPTQEPRRGALAEAGDAVVEAAPALIAYSCLVLAVFFLPGRRTRAGVVFAAVGTGIAVAYVGLELWSRDRGLAGAIAAVPPLLVAVFALVVAGRAARWRTTGGLAVVALAALWLLDDVLDRVSVHRLDAFLEPGLRYSTQETAAVVLAAPVGATAAGWAIAPAIPLVAAAAVTVACLRRRPAPPP